MKAATKSIFDKSYIIEAQATKAAEKEFGANWANGHKITFDEATKKFRVQPLKTPAEAVVELEHATHEVVAHLTAMPKATKDRVTLQEALEESGQTIEELIEVEHNRRAADKIADAALIEPAFVMPENCPHCDINLENGVGVHGDEVNGSIIKHAEFELACLSCGGEFGPSINAKPAGTGIAFARTSTCERPTKKVWIIADSMPKASRKEVMAECVVQGVAYGTARTQYQAWFKASQEGSNVEVRKPYQKGE